MKDSTNWIKSIKLTSILNGRTKTDNQDENSKKNCDQVNLYSVLNDQIILNDYLNCSKKKKTNKISFLNSALKTINLNKKSECNQKPAKLRQNSIITLPSVYLEEHKGMDWRLQQLLYQLPEQDERLLADNPHLSNELKFLRAQQNICSIPVKLYISNEKNFNQNIDNQQVNKNHEDFVFCSKCEKIIDKKVYCVQADLSNLNFNSSTCKNEQKLTPALLNVYFHIDCLQCITCNEILVDFRAFLDPRTIPGEKPLRIYCSRHFLELFKPRCDFCEELIFDKKCTQAEGKAWHVSHFCCFNCRLPLGGQQYKMADINKKNNRTHMKLKDLHENFSNPNSSESKIFPFCLSCCDQLFGEYCARCDKLINCDQNPVKFENYFWHASPECFHCDTCGVSLVNSDYLPSSSAKQIYCSNECVQAIQAKDLSNLNNGLMKMNDKLRNSVRKPALNSVVEENFKSSNQDILSFSSSSSENKSVSIVLSDNELSTPEKIVEKIIKNEYENSSVFHLAKNFNSLKSDSKDQQINSNNNNLSTNSSDQSCSMTSLTLLFNSSFDKNQQTDELNLKEKNNEINIKKTDDIITSNEVKEDLNENFKTSLLKKDNQKLVPCVIVNNKPYTRTSIIIDNSALSTMKFLGSNLNLNNDNCVLNVLEIENDSSEKIVKLNSEDKNLVTNLSCSLNEKIEQQPKSCLINQTHYSTLPNKKTQHKLNQENKLLQNLISKTFSSQTMINFNLSNSINEVGLPILNNNNISKNISKINSNNLSSINDSKLSNFTNCTLPRINRNQSNLYQKNLINCNTIDEENSYLNGLQSLSVSKLNATMLQTSLNFKPKKFLSDSIPNINYLNTNNVINNNLNSHSVIVSEDQIEKLDSKLIVKPLSVMNDSHLNNVILKPPTRAPPLPPADQQPSQKLSNLNDISNNSNNHELPVIQEDNLILSESSERMSSATPSIVSLSEENNEKTLNSSKSSEYDENLQREIQFKNLNIMKNLSCSNNSLTNINQTNLNSSNSASLRSATSSISSNNSSNETTSQASYSNSINNRPDVILNPIETIKQLKIKKREIKLKEKMKKEQLLKEQKPIIVEEKLKDGSILKNYEDKELKKKSTINTENVLNKSKLKTNSVSNSLNYLYRDDDNNLKSLITHQSQPNLIKTQNDKTYKDEKLNHVDIKSNLPKFSSQNYPVNNLSNDTDNSSVANTVDMDTIVQFKNSKVNEQPLLSSTSSADLIREENIHYSNIQFKNSTNNLSKKRQSLLKDQISNKQSSENNYKQKSVSFDPNVIENENNRAPRRINRKNSYSSRKKYSCDQFKSHSKSYHNYNKSKHNSKKYIRKKHYVEEDDVCSTCSSCSYSSSSCYSSSSSEDEEHSKKKFSCNGRKNKQLNCKHEKTSNLKLINSDNLSKLKKNITSMPPEQMVQIMHQQQLIIQQQLAQQLVQQIQPQQIKQKRYLKNNTNESCVIS